MSILTFTTGLHLFGYCPAQPTNLGGYTSAGVVTLQFRCQVPAFFQLGNCDWFSKGEKHSSNMTIRMYTTPTTTTGSSSSSSRNIVGVRVEVPTAVGVYCCYYYPLLVLLVAVVAVVGSRVVGLTIMNSNIY